VLDTGNRSLTVNCTFGESTGLNSLVCDLVTVDILQLLEVNRDFLPVWGAFGVKDERGLGSGGHVSVD